MVDPSKSKPDWPEVIVHTLEAGLLLGQGTPAKDGLQVHPLPLDLVEVVQQLIEVCKTLLPHWCLVLKALVVRRVLQWLQQALVVSHLRRDETHNGVVNVPMALFFTPSPDPQRKGQFLLQLTHSGVVSVAIALPFTLSTDTQMNGQLTHNGVVNVPLVLPFIPSTNTQRNGLFLLQLTHSGVVNVSIV